MSLELQEVDNVKIWNTKKRHRKPGCTGRAKALAKTFKKMAKKRKNA